ncbi:hypothetical protein D9M73_177460 [compost metagenome]
MYVIDSLPTQFIAVHDDAEAVFATQFLCQALGGEQDVPRQCLVVLGQVVQGANGFLRDHQEMYRCLWGNVVEGQNLVVLVNDLRRDFPVDDLGEQSIHSCFSVVWAGLSVPMESAPAQCFTAGRFNAGSGP